MIKKKEFEKIFKYLDNAFDGYTIYEIVGFLECYKDDIIRELKDEDTIKPKE